MTSANYLAGAIDFFDVLVGQFRFCRLAIAVTKGSAICRGISKNFSFVPWRAAQERGKLKTR